MQLKEWLDRPLGRLPYPLGRLAVGLLGLTVGVALLFTCLALGGGAGAELARLDAAFGTNVIIIKAARTGAPLGEAVVSELTARLPEAKQVFGVSERQASIERPGLTPVSALLVGADSRVAQLKGWTLAEGRLIVATDLTEARPVVVLGSLTADRLFPASEKRTAPRIGSEVLINGMSFTVIGILAPTPTTATGTLRDGDGCILIPLPTALKLSGTDQLSAIAVQAPTRAAIRTVAGHARLVLSELARGAHTLTTARDIYRDRYAAVAIATWLFAGATAVSCALGASALWLTLRFGNHERREEFFVRITQGATRRQLLLEYLTHVAGLGLCAGVAGILVGLGITGAITAVVAWPLRLTGATMVLSLTAAIVASLLAGIEPAGQVTAMDSSAWAEV